MGGCATKPKVLKGDDPPEPRQAYKEDAKREPVTHKKPRDSVTVEEQSDGKVVAKDGGENKPAEISDISSKVDFIVGGDDKVEEQGGQRRSLSLLFNKESKEGDVVTQGDNALPEELTRQEPVESDKITDEAQSDEAWKQEASLHNEQSSGECGKDEKVPLETQKASGESEDVAPVKQVPAEQELPADAVKNELPTEPEVEKAGKAENSEISVTEQEPREVVKHSNEAVKEEASNYDEIAGEPGTKFVEAETKLEELSKVDEASEEPSTKFVEAETKLEEPSDVNEISDAKFVESYTKLEEPSNVIDPAGESDTKTVEAETIENLVEQTGTEKEVREPSNPSAVVVDDDDTVAKGINESSDVLKNPGAPDSESSDGSDKISRDAHKESSDAKDKTSRERHTDLSNVNKTTEEHHSESSDVKKASGEPNSGVPEIKPLEKPVEQIRLAVALAPSEDEATANNNQPTVVVDSDDKLAKVTTE